MAGTHGCHDRECLIGEGIVIGSSELNSGVEDICLSVLAHVDDPWKSVNLQDESCHDNVI